MMLQSSPASKQSFLRFLIRVIAPVLVLPAALSAGIVAIAQGSASGPFTGPTYVDASGAFAATARLTDFPAAGGSFANESYSSTVFGDPKCLFCGQSMDARITGDGTGTVKLFTGVGMTTNSRGIASVRLELTDIIDLSSPLEISLDSFFSRFDRGPAILSTNPYITYANFHMGLQLYNVDNPGNTYLLALEAVKAYTRNPTLSFTDYWTVQETVGASSPVTLLGPTPIDSANGHFDFSRTVNLSPTPGSWNVTYYVDSEALCTGGPSINCASIFDSWSTSYLGLSGNFTSQNGYQYSGLSDPTSAVPEPGTSILLLPLMAGMVLARRAFGIRCP